MAIDRKRLVRALAFWSVGGLWIRASWHLELRPSNLGVEGPK